MTICFITFLFCFLNQFIFILMISLRYMNIDFEWSDIFSKYKDYVFIVEGRKDADALNNLGFRRVFTINKIGVSLREIIEKIVCGIDGKDKVCILTDFDKKGKQLYKIIKKEMAPMGVRIDSSLRKILLIMGVSHIEGLDSFVDKLSTG